ncbi:hypothetical protein [Novosphingobium guangzhouense]|uniref:Argininosuccinate lyase n=1 Tax=Novosphingobium guangzhouense TaxID=1850347 RepID=A0A2K2FZ01_9SPHN|nr:hypothetical protein [Novosphingobium guangzhouense]PNU03982.1 hypothetical protein A8V01_05025 [Novosphingobium guangzhouense]
MRTALSAMALLALAACSKSDTAPGPGGVTMGEARALDEAAAMLDERRPPSEGQATEAPAAPER